MHRNTSSLSALSALSALATLSAFALLTPACEVDSTTAGPLPDSDHDAGAPVIECPAPTAGPTRHQGDVEDGEVWTAAGSPHIVEYDVNVRDGKTLTIEPCAEVRFASEKSINVAYPLTPNSGTLIAEGTPTKPIKFTGDNGARWGSIFVHAPGTARFAHATFEDGGEGGFDGGATIVGYGDNDMPADPVLFVDNVTIKRSRGPGISLTRRSSFIAGSKELTITESGSEEAPFPLVITEHTIDGVPTGKYTGNKKDEILLHTIGDGMAGSGLVTDATLHERGVPYRMGDDEGDSFVIGGGTDGNVVTLTIEPGVIMRFHPKTGFRVQTFSTEEPSTAIVRAIGTAEKPIVFTSAADSPAAGDWRGLWFGGVPQAANALEHVRIEYAGHDCSCSMVTCSANLQGYDGAVIFGNQPPSAFIKNSVFKDIAGNGVVQGFDGTFVNFRPTNTFENVAGCLQTLPRDIDTTCPDPAPMCDGM